MAPEGDPPPIPEPLATRYAAWDWKIVSHYPPHSATYRVTDGSGEARFVKITAPGWMPSAAAEAARLRWAVRHLRVPRVLEDGESQSGTWLVTAGLVGGDGCEAALHMDRRRLAVLLAEGLGELHGAPAEGCPFQFRIEDALRVAVDRLEGGQIVEERDFHPEHAHLTAAAAVERLFRTRPAAEDLVVCHGDYCPPNVLIDGESVVGYVDLGELGVADRWWDLAVATWSIEWNLGRGLDEAFYAAYGVAPDPSRIAFYRLLYDVVS